MPPAWPALLAQHLQLHVSLRAWIAICQVLLPEGLAGAEPTVLAAKLLQLVPAHLCAAPAEGLVPCSPPLGAALPRSTRGSSLLPRHAPLVAFHLAPGSKKTRQKLLFPQRPPSAQVYFMLSVSKRDRSRDVSAPQQP